MLVAWQSEEVQSKLARSSSRPVMLPTPRIRTGFGAKNRNTPVRELARTA
jgi:hypothetical protein